MDTQGKVPNTIGPRNIKYWCSVRRLRLSLKYRPEILKLVLKMRQCIRKKNALLKKLTRLKFTDKNEHLHCQKFKDIGNQNASKDLLPSINNENKEQDNSNNLIESQRNVITNLNAPIESKLDSNITNADIILFDKSTSCDYSVKDNFSQTKSNNVICENSHVEEDENSLLSVDKEKSLNGELSVLEAPGKDLEPKHHKEISATVDNSQLIQTNTEKQDLKEAFTQTEYSFEDPAAMRLALRKSDADKISINDNFTQTENAANHVEEPVSDELNNSAKAKPLGWTNDSNGDEEKSIAEQVKEVAQSAMQQSGMVYVESAGMYYDYKTGYYYNSELGLYYHTDTGCYYYYSDDQKTFVFHSYPDRSNEVQNRPAKPIRKSKIHKKAKNSDDIENLTKNFSQDEDDAGASKPKRKRMTKHKKRTKKIKKSDTSKKDRKNKNEKESKDEQKDDKHNELKVENKDNSKQNEELEDGECSDSSDEKPDSVIDESDASTATASDEESVAKHHPPCMRVIVRETSLPKLKVGSLFLVTKDGGTVGREGEHHAILLKDYNVSRNHLDIKFDADKRIYTVVDLGSKNGTILNGVRMSESQEISEAMEVLHGSTLQLGETKLLCHIHAGNDTCGHCEPGLIMEAEEKEKKVAYTRTCSVQVQHQLELARLKNKYAPQPLEIMDTEYNDRAQARREKVGSSHHSEKTQSSDLDTAIAADNKGFKLLEKMGWSKGEGLGKDSQGDTEPIPLISNEGKSGLGAVPVPSTAPVITSKLGPATLRLAARTKMLQPPAKAFQQPAEEDSE